MAVITGSNSFLNGDYFTELNTNVAGSDVIDLRAGNDYLEAGSGADSVDAGYGNDTVFGGLSGDLIHGGFGHDNLSGDEGSDTIWGDHGDDTIYGDDYNSSGGDGADTLYGGSGNDRLFGGAGADRMYGGNGDDKIDLGLGNFVSGDSVNGGAGVDQLLVSFKLHNGFVDFTASDYIAGSTIDDGITIVGIESFWIRGTDNADQITGWKLNDELMGGLGSDRLKGKEGDDRLWGGDRADTILGGTGNDFIYGDDTGYYDFTESGTPVGNDLVYGGFGNDVIDGDGGADRLFGDEGNDNMDGGDGADTVDGGQGSDLLEGGGEPGSGGDTVYGGSGDDDLYSYLWLSHDNGNVRDFLYGGSGSDEVWAGVRDVAIGGDQAGSFDILRLTFDDLPAGAFGENLGVTYNLAAQGQILTTLANQTQVDGFEALQFYGSNGADRVTGAGYSDNLYGGGGGDVLNGGSGNDILDGEDGADRLEGGNGADTFSDSDRTPGGWADVANGGAGNDRFNDGAGADTLRGDAGDDAFQLGAFLRPEDFSADSVVGGSGWDYVSYDDADIGVVVDLVNQGNNAGCAVGDRFAGIEEVEGSLYDDFLFGNDLGNALLGGGSDDVINGRGGADAIWGGDGSDQLTGGAGADEFVLESDQGYFDNHWPHDVITDFTKGVDKLVIYETEFGVDVSTFRLVNQATEVAKGRGPVFVFETDASRLWFDEDGAGRDTDGDGVIDQNVDAILVATLQGVTSLAGGNFLIHEL